VFFSDLACAACVGSATSFCCPPFRLCIDEEIWWATVNRVAYPTWLESVMYMYLTGQPSNSRNAGKRPQPQACGAANKLFMVKGNHFVAILVACMVYSTLSEVVRRCVAVVPQRRYRLECNNVPKYWYQVQSLV
jgi:hypothetical protein